MELLQMAAIGVCVVAVIMVKDAIVTRVKRWWKSRKKKKSGE